MRMWMVNPTAMCRKHLLGEHVEMHMLVGHIKLGRAVEGYVRNNLLESARIKARHDALAAEMLRRGYNHRSELVYVDKLRAGKINKALASQELMRRCSECRAMLKVAT